MKGQTAIEYLMTYGWAILIILIVAGVLAYYGIFAPSGFLGPTSKGWTQIYAMQPWDLASDGTLKLQIENRVGQDITFNQISAASGTGILQVCTLTSPSSFALVPQGKQWPTNDLMTLDCSSGVGTANTGNSYSITVEIEYAVGGTSLLQKGTLSGTRS